MYIYIAGPYSGGDPVINVQRAIAAAEEVLHYNHVPFVPHLSHLWHLVKPHPYDFWIAMDLAWLMKCDAVLRIPGESPGADEEVKLARALSKPVYYSINEIPDPG